MPAIIADLVLELPPPVLADAECASREITRFDAELGGEIAPFAAVLLRSESAASSQIENLTASARAIAEAELPGSKAKRNAEMIVANTAAMHAAVALSDTIDAAAIRAMHRALMATNHAIRRANSAPNRCGSAVARPPSPQPSSVLAMKPSLAQSATSSPTIAAVDRG